MVHKVPDLISRASRIMTLERGDLLATGTPAGVREIRDGDVLVGTIERVGRVEARVARKV
jgi:2-keto-4-pentenoate hydratase/2-oxohepta-3-ene-1,7-dioic acid hydratase in catechol pathway